MASEEPFDGGVSLGQGAGQLAGNCFFGVVGVEGGLFFVGDELDFWDVDVSCQHVRNF